MTDKGLEYLLNFCKIKKGERVGDLEAVDFQVYGDGRQMEHLLIDCICHKCNRRSVQSPFQIPASVLNWKITKYQKGGISTLDCGCSWFVQLLDWMTHSSGISSIFSFWTYIAFSLAWFQARQLNWLPWCCCLLRSLKTHQQWMDSASTHAVLLCLVWCSFVGGLPRCFCWLSLAFLLFSVIKVTRIDEKPLLSCFCREIDSDNQRPLLFPCGFCMLLSLMIWVSGIEDWRLNCN